MHKIGNVSDILTIYQCATNMANVCKIRVSFIKPAQLFMHIASMSVRPLIRWLILYV